MFHNMLIICALQYGIGCHVCAAIKKIYCNLSWLQNPSADLSILYSQRFTTIQVLHISPNAPCEIST